MIKNSLLLFLILLTFSNTAFAEHLYLKVTPEKEISTADTKVQEGNYYNFVVTEDLTYKEKNYFKKGDVITGLLTEKTENGTGAKNASLYFTQFKKDSIPINTILYERGNQRDTLYEALGNIFILFRLNDAMRGGEVKMNPNKNIYTLEFEVKQ